MSIVQGKILQNRYRIESSLGQGGMANVHRATDMRLEVEVAVKEMLALPDLDPEMLNTLRQQFRREAVILAKLKHPNLVGVTDYFEENASAFLVMDFVEGESLADRIEREGKIPESIVLTWAEQLLDALAYCHNNNIIHRDIKPQNVIIRPDGQAVLVDFGLVKLWNPSDPHTKTMMRGMGTPEYAPPEQYDAKLGHTDPRSDIYSLGATLYHAFTGGSPPTVTVRIADPDISQYILTDLENVSEQTRQAIQTSIQLARTQRWSSAGAMAEALGLEVTHWAPSASDGLHTAQSATRSSKTQIMDWDTVESTPLLLAESADEPVHIVDKGHGHKRRLSPLVWAIVGVMVLGVAAAGYFGGMFDSVFAQQTNSSTSVVKPTFTASAITTNTPTTSPPTATPDPGAELLIDEYALDKLNSYRGRISWKLDSAGEILDIINLTVAATHNPEAFHCIAGADGEEMQVIKIEDDAWAVWANSGGEWSTESPDEYNVILNFIITADDLNIANWNKSEYVYIGEEIVNDIRTYHYFTENSQHFSDLISYMEIEDVEAVQLDIWVSREESLPNTLVKLVADVTAFFETSDDKLMINQEFFDFNTPITIADGLPLSLRQDLSLSSGAETSLLPRSLSEEPEYYDILVATEDGTSIIRSGDGKVLQEISTKWAESADYMPNGHILIVESKKVREYTLDGAIVNELPQFDMRVASAISTDNQSVWVYKGSGTGSGDEAVLHLDWDGNVLAESTGYHYPFEVRSYDNTHIIVVDGSNVLDVIDMSGDLTDQISFSNWVTSVSVIPDIGILSGTGAGVSLVDEAGIEIPVYTGERVDAIEYLPWGHILMVIDDRLIELDGVGNVLWEITIPGINRVRFGNVN